MCGTISSARQAGGHAHHAGRPPGTPVRIPPIPDPQGNDLTARWPLRNFLELGALPSAVPCARLHTRQLLWEWQLTDRGDAELLVSELMTNAIQASQADDRTASVRLWLLADQAQVVILVWDASPLPPVAMNGSETEENGRGLLLVDTLSERWGYLPADHGGKFVWAIVALTRRTQPAYRMTE